MARSEPASEFGGAADEEQVPEPQERRAGPGTGRRAPAVTPGTVAVAHRQSQAFELAVVRHLTLVETAEALGVSRSTVARDLAAQRGRLRAALRERRGTEEGLLDGALDLLAEASSVQRMAWLDLAQLQRTAPARARLLAVILGATQTKLRLLERAGLLDPAAADDELEDGMLIARLNDHELAALRLSLDLMRAVDAAESRRQGAGRGIVAEAMRRLLSVVTETADTAAECRMRRT